jgi:hypothetical protein
MKHKNSCIFFTAKEYARESMKFLKSLKIKFPAIPAHIRSWHLGFPHGETYYIGLGLTVPQGTEKRI